VAITVTLIGSGPEQAAAGGTNSTASVTSQSATWVAGDYVLVALGVHHNFGTDWVGTGLTSSGGTLAAADIETTAPNLAMGGYKSGASFLLAQVTAGFTGTITASRTAGNSDHWLTGTFYKLTGVNGTIVQAKVNNQAAGTNTLALNLTSAPASTSLLVALLLANANQAWSTLAGWTETERAETGWLADHSVQYINGSGAQNNTFTNTSNTGGQAGIVIEIADAGGGGGTPFLLLLEDGSKTLLEGGVDALGIEQDNAGGGSTFNLNVSGSLTASGSLTRQGRKNVAGSVTPAGTVVRQAGKKVAGSSTPSGAVTRQAGKVLAGASTATGALTKQARTNLAGSATPAGTLTAIRAAVLNLAGSLTPAGVLTKRANKALAGSTTSSGALAKQAGKQLAGGSTPTGALTAIRAAVLNLAGSLTPSGALVRQARKQLTGSTTSSGTLARQTSKPLAGSSTPSGIVRRQAGKPLAGAVTSSGNLVRRAGLALAGTTSPSGVVAKRLSKLLTGALTAVGNLVAAGNSNLPTTSGPVGIMVYAASVVTVQVSALAASPDVADVDLSDVTITVAPQSVVTISIHPEGRP